MMRKIDFELPKILKLVVKYFHFKSILILFIWNLQLVSYLEYVLIFFRTPKPYTSYLTTCLQIYQIYLQN